MPNQLWTITRNTFMESIRQPVFIVLILTGILLLVLSVFWTAYSMEHGADNIFLIETGLSMVAVMTLLLAAFTATGVVAEEIENRTVLTVVSKPVARPIFILGKYLGVAAAIGIAYFILSAALIMSVRHGVMSTASDKFDGPVLVLGFGSVLISFITAAGANYYFNRVFSSTFVATLLICAAVSLLLVSVLGKEWVFQSPMHDLMEHNGRMLQLVIGQFLVLQAMWVLTAVAIATSTRLGQVMTLLVCIAVALIGVSSHSFSDLVDSKLEIPAMLNVYESFSAIFSSDLPLHFKLLSVVTKGTYVVMPNLQFLWPADAISSGNAFSLGHVAVLTVYSTLQTGMILALAVILFQKREVG